MRKIASSGSKEGVLKLIKEFYFTDNILITDSNEVYNTKLNKKLGSIEFKKNEYNYIVV